jgi:hypothetical protein
MLLPLVMGSATLNVVNVTTSRGVSPVFWLCYLLSATHCYHPDCGGKPIQFCPYGGNHPS